MDKAVANATSTVKRFDLARVKIERGEMLTDEQLALRKPYKRFEFTERGISPRAVVGQPGGIFWNTGDEHDETGHITEDPYLRAKMMEKRMGKLDVIAKEIPLSEKLAYYGEPRPDLLVVGWGSVKGAVLDNLDTLKESGIKAGFLQIKMMCPFPAGEVAKVIKSAQRTVIVECNYSGQLRKLITQETGITIPQLVTKYTGRPVLCDELLESLIRLYRAPNLKREVLRVGA